MPNTVKPCLTCGALSRAGSRCGPCGQAHERARSRDYETRRPSRNNAAAYGRAWKAKAHAAIQAQPWCSVAGCASMDLTGDHVRPLSQGGTADDGIVVLCRFHNAQRGAKPLA